MIHGIICMLQDAIYICSEHACTHSEYRFQWLVVQYVELSSLLAEGFFTNKSQLIVVDVGSWRNRPKILCR